MRPVLTTAIFRAAAFALLAAFAASPSGPVAAQGSDLSPFLQGCAEIADLRKRLACYDSLTDRKPPAPAPGPPGPAPSSPDRAPAAPGMPSPPTADPRPRPTGEPINCRAELQCWGERHLATANAYCKDSIDRLANDATRWSDAFHETRFSRLRWLDRSKGTLTFIGDKVEFRTASGSYQPHRYECDFDPENNRVTGARAQPGRLQ